MCDRNTIVIESNHYTNKVKYLWKNDRNTLSDLSENSTSVFSKNKSDYKKFSTSSLTEIAPQVVRTIVEKYNDSGNGLDIVVNGTEEDYLAIKNVIGNSFPDQGMECTWGEHTKLPTEVMMEIRKIYDGLKTSLENDGQGIIELSDRNDKDEWLRSGFNWEGFDDEKILYTLCAKASVYLDRVMAEIKVEVERSSDEVSKMKKRLECVITHEAGDGLKTEAEVDIERLSKIMKKICEKHTKEMGKKFENLLKDYEKKEYLDEDRIMGLIRKAEEYADMHPIEWRKSSPADNLIGKDVDEQGRKECVLKKIGAYLNEDIKKYVDVINSDGIRFGDGSIVKLKRKFMEEVSDSKKFTDEQKNTVGRWLSDGESVDVSYRMLKWENLIEENRFKWKKKDFKEKDICKKYQEKLGEELKDKRNNVLKENNKIFEEWGNAFFEMRKEQELNMQPDSLQNEEQIRKKLKECQKKEKRLADILDKFREGRKRIDALISFR